MCLRRWPLPRRPGRPVRSVPDISADADPFTGFAVGCLTFTTRAASRRPTASRGRRAPAGPRRWWPASWPRRSRASGPFGFVDPALYQLAGTSALHDAPAADQQQPGRGPRRGVHPARLRPWALTTFDDQSTKMLGYTGQVTLPGYDNMTGVGTPPGRPSSRPAIDRGESRNWLKHQRDGPAIRQGWRTGLSCFQGRQGMTRTLPLTSLAPRPPGPRRCRPGGRVCSGSSVSARWRGVRCPHRRPPDPGRPVARCRAA